MSVRGAAMAAPFLMALLAGCSGGKESAPAAAPVPAAAPEGATAEAQSGAAPISNTSVTLYFPSASGDGLVSETREIVDTKRPADRGAQIVAALIAGPQSDDALPVFPPGTTLRQLWVRADGNAYADFSDELAAGLSGGSAEEIRMVYAVVDSLTTNVPAIRRVGILVAGRESQSLGHLDLRRPLPPDLSLAASPKKPE